MLQKNLNEENDEIKDKAYELYEKHGFKDGNDFIDWLEAEKLFSHKSRTRRFNIFRNLLLTIIGLLAAIILILLLMLFRPQQKLELSDKSIAALKVLPVTQVQTVPDEVITFGDTHFAYNKSTLTKEAEVLLDKEVVVLKENPAMKVRMAGYTSASGTDESNQILSENRANSVKNYLIEKGIAAKRISVIGYGRTRPALYEVSPSDINTKEAKANMRVLFEVVVE